MVTEGADLITVAKPEKKSLLEKYDISVDNLSYEYISGCTDGKTLERIVKILRSGEEGVYPDLTRHAEERLTAIKPNSMILRKTVPVLTRNMLGPDERKELDDDINDWTREMYCREKNLNEEKTNLTDDPFVLPDVRHVDEISPMKKDTEQKGNANRKSKRLASCDYAAWDKYDVDTEINRIDLQEEREQIKTKEIQRKQKETEEKRKSASKEIALNKSSLTSTEIDLMAERERKKGNEAFRIGDYADALRFYDSSIAINPCPAAYNNRAMTLIKLQRYEDALKDCDTVLLTEERNVKALLRRALCFDHLEKRHEALVDYEAILKLEPANNLAIAGVKKLRKPCDSKKVRMKIEELSSEENDKSEHKRKTDNIAKCIPQSSLDVVKKTTIENTVCVCEKGPGPSHSNKPLPHMKGIYCVRNESKKTSANSSDISRSLMNMNLLSSSKELSTHSQDESLVLTRKQTVPIINKEKSIFSCKTKTDTSVSSSGVVIEEIPNESNAKDAKPNVNSYKTNMSHAMKNDDRAKDKVKSNHDTVDRRKFHPSPRKIEVASKYIQPCRKEKDIFTNLENITSPYEFLRAWQSLKDDNDLQQHARLLRALASKDLNTVIGNKLDGTMFSLILRCLERHFRTSQDRDLVARYLKSLSQLSRFSIVKMFMDNNDKKVLTNVFRFLEEQGSTEVSILREVYA
ncbi:hypothetical protein KPH14_004302 [Odynerus spinipes]|uniref:RNA-polymerase II-associated protein 3-like C-terminal domain-containing protein n=1 Tax=Odynerus spinipes TaxID=1348599 RepID=A0AAD9RZ46_9HYME|nr:hypothetical protein KPH14_004302 [Odynerus spinipes]